MGANGVLLVEDDDQMAGLLALVVETACPGARVDRCADVADAESRFSPQRHRLVLCDWNLPGRPGISLLPVIRAAQPRVPVLMVSGRTDRASVVTARAQGVDGFVGKPFEVEQLVRRLIQYLPPLAPEAEAENADTPPLLDFLGALDDSALEAPLVARLGALTSPPAADEAPDLGQLAESWARQPVLTGRLLAMANSSAFNQPGQLCRSLLEALQRLGWRSALNVATALALRQGGELEDPRLAQRIILELDRCERVAEALDGLARQARLDPAPLQTAALMHRLGELSVVMQVAAWQGRYQRQASDEELEAALTRFARPFAHRLKMHWSYPMHLRELIGALYQLAPGASRPELMLLRIAGGVEHGDLDEAELAKLRRLVFD